MKNAFIRYEHRLYGVDSLPNAIEFETTEDLLNLDFFKSIENFNGFKQYEISGSNIIAVFYNSWFFMGSIAFSNDIELPQWDDSRDLDKFDVATHRF